MGLFWGHLCATNSRWLTGGTGPQRPDRSQDDGARPHASRAATRKRRGGARISIQLGCPTGDVVPRSHHDLLRREPPAEIDGPWYELASHLVHKYVRGTNGSPAELLFEVFDKRVK